jgi:uncharacterized surface protein with fasciclin (FAS1) repeats
MRRKIASAVLAALMATVVAAPAIASDYPTLGEQILADADGQFDKNQYDYDIIGEVVLAIVQSGIDTQLGASLDPSVELTAFLPNDRAFKLFQYDLTGVWIGDESKVIPAILDAVGGNLDLVNAVVEYHVVPGVIDSSVALGADGVSLTSIMGASFTVDVKNASAPRIVLVDNEPDLYNARISPWDLDNFASNGVWHGISRVLIPIDL